MTHPTHPIFAFPAKPVLLALLLVATDVVAGERGEAVFEQHCIFCHSLDPGYHRRGPSLAGVVGRRGGSAAGYGRYSQAMRRSGLVWTAESLAVFLADPQARVPGTRMVDVDLPRGDDLKALIDFLQDSR